MTRRPCLSATLALGLLVAGCQPPTSQVPDPDRPRRIVDLSPVITEDLPVRVWGTQLLDLLGFRHGNRFELVVTNQGTFVQNAYWTLMNHGGPHLDAPNHMERGESGVDAYPLERLFGRIHLVDVRSHPPAEPIPRSVLVEERIVPDRIVLLLTGYTPPTSAAELPSYAYLSKEAAEYLAELPVRGLGTDGLGVDCIRCFFSPEAEGRTGYENLLPVHHALLPHGIPLFESLVGLEALLGEDHAVFVGFPLKVKDGDGSPIRAAALVY